MILIDKNLESSNNDPQGTLKDGVASEPIEIRLLVGLIDS